MSWNAYQGRPDPGHATGLNTLKNATHAVCPLTACF